MKVLAWLVLVPSLVLGLMPHGGEVADPTMASEKQNVVYSEDALEESLSEEGLELVEAEIDSEEVSVETVTELDSGEEISQSLVLDNDSGTAEFTVESDSEDIVSGTYQVDVLQVDEELIWFTVTNPDTGEKSEYRSDQADYSVIPLALILAPSLGAIFKALFVASAVVVIAGVTYIAADKAIAGIREAIRKKKNPPAHYKVVRRTNGLLIGDGMSKNEAVSRARASGDVWSTTKAGARSVAYSVRSKTPVGPEKDKTNSSKKYCHYHPSGRSPGSHAFYGVAGQAC